MLAFALRQEEAVRGQVHDAWRLDFPQLSLRGVSPKE